MGTYKKKEHRVKVEAQEILETETKKAHPLKKGGPISIPVLTVS